MKRPVIFLSLLLTSMILMGASLTLVKRSPNYSVVTGTYAASQVDTISYSVEGNEQALRFYVHSKDTVNITSIITRRVVDSKLMGVQVGDTISGAIAALTDTLISGSVPVTTPCQSLKVFVTYAGTFQGVTTPNVTYTMAKRY